MSYIVGVHDGGVYPSLKAVDDSDVMAEDGDKS